MLQRSKLIELGLHACFFSLFVMSIVLYKERLFADASYYFFHAINSGGFHVEHGRIVLALSQIAPLFAYYLQLPLQMIMLAASLGHELFYYGIFLVLFYRLKDYTAALTVLLIHLIGQLWLYYSPMLEICYGAGLAVLFAAILKSGKYKDDKWLILLLVTQWFVMTSHPENFILIALALLYEIISKRIDLKMQLISWSGLVLGFIIELLTFSEYEKGHSNINHDNDTIGASNLLNEEYLQQLAKLFWNYYPELMVISAISILIMLFKKRWLKLCLLLGSIGFILLIVNHMAEATVFTRYYESMYNPLVFIVVFIGLQEIASNLKGKMQSVFALAVFGIAISRMFWIWDSGEHLRQRMDQLDKLVDYTQNFKETKFLVNSENWHSYYTTVTWANPIETLLISAIDGKEKSKTIAMEGDYLFERNYMKLKDSDFIFRRFEIEPLSFLNERLFHLKKEPYLKLNGNKADMAWQEFNTNVSISLLGEQPNLLANDSAYLFINIEVNEGYTLPSNLEENIYLSYHWYQQGEVIEWDGLRTPMEVDVIGNYSQHLKIKTPIEAGHYELVPDLVIEGVDWINLSQRFELKIEQAHI